jgi:ribonucleoside-diphosphate reductase alpha chain
MITQVRKRDGRIEAFRPRKITDAIRRSLFDFGVKTPVFASRLSREVVKALEVAYPREVPGVENIQDTVISVLDRWNPRAAGLYRDYREKKARLRQARLEFGIEGKLSYNALAVLERRYLRRDESGKLVETPKRMFRRVARAVARVERDYGNDPARVEEEFFLAMSRLEFLPNSPTLFNAGTRHPQLSACFVLPVEDSLDSIFSALKETALIEKSGGGVGFSFSRLRSRGDLVKSTLGVASGPVSFMRVFDTTTDVIKAGGKRRGAMMGVLRVDHPDILDFISAKSDSRALRNFNLSVGVTDAFMEAVNRDRAYDLINPRTGEAVNRLRAGLIWDRIVQSAWKTGDPGLLFLDEVNRRNPTAQLGLIESTNPCGEVILHPYESCNLGSINLTRILEKSGRNYRIDWEKLRKLVRLAVRFLDNVVDANHYPFPAIVRITRANRRIGLGVMGFADLLFLLKIPYDSGRALRTGGKIMKFIAGESHRASVELGKARGSFPNFRGSLWEKRGVPAMRNATTTVIAPTGTLSIIAGCSSGIEPVFALSFVRRVLEGRELLEINPVFESAAKARGFYSAELMLEIARAGSIRKVRGVPEDLRKIFVTALEIQPGHHVRIQAAFQKWVDNSVSKTVNFPREATPEDIKKVFLLAHRLKCKGITVYRYGSRDEQVLSLPKRSDLFLAAESEFSGGCPTGTCQTA